MISQTEINSSITRGYLRVHTSYVRDYTHAIKKLISTLTK